MPKQSNKELLNDTAKTDYEYDVEEFINAAGVIFGEKVMPDCITAAFRLVGLKKATKSKAQEIISNFLHKEVK